MDIYNCLFVYFVKGHLYFFFKVFLSKCVFFVKFNGDFKYIFKKHLTHVLLVNSYIFLGNAKMTKTKLTI